MDQDNCDECCLRLNELVGWMKDGLALAEVRDGLFIELLRTKIDQKMTRDDQINNALCSAVITARCDLETNKEHAEEMMRLAKDEIEQFIDSIRERSGDNDAEETTLVLAAENVQLAKVVSMCTERLDTELKKVQSIKNQVDQKRLENEQIRSNAARAISDAKQNQCGTKT